MTTDRTNRDDVILAARGLTRSFGKAPACVQVLHGVDLAVRAGEFLAVTGPSGCGKSTLLHILGLMDRPDAGELTLAGETLAPGPEARRERARREEIGFVFQRFNLLNVLSAEDNIAISNQVRRQRMDKREIRELLESMGIGTLARRKPTQMSIGEQQRVAIARAVAHRPALLLADEPTGSLDSDSAQRVMELLIRANRTQNQTIVMITHSSAVAAAADRVLRMRDGRLHDS